jgi:hypothetical protein
MLLTLAIGSVLCSPEHRIPWVNGYLQSACEVMMIEVGLYEKRRKVMPLYETWLRSLRSDRDKW